MMKTKLIYVFLSLALLSSCSSEDYDSPLQQGGETLQLSVRVGSFVTDGASDTRATGSDEKTAFEDGDRMGIIVLDKDNNILSDNIPYKYSSSAWSFDSNSNEGKVAVNYNNRASTYLAYFPYSKGADGINSIDGLKEKFQPLSDQRTQNAYRASDLLVWNGTYEVSPQKLEIVLEHVYSLLSFPSSVNITCNVIGVSTPVTYSSSLMSDVSFTLGGNPYSAYKAADGSYRIITAPQRMTTSDRWLVAYGAKTYSGSMSATTLAEKTRYTLTSPSLSLGDYSLDNAKMGDFYCKSSDGSTGYLLPGEITTLTDGQKAACLGVVLKAGKDDSGNWQDTDSYKLKGTTTDMTDFHGYVLALKNGNGGTTCAWGSSGTQVGTDQSQNILFCGYSNTQTIKKYATDNSKTLQNDFPAAYHASDGYETREDNKYSSPGNSSGWFLPSAGQCNYWLQNRDFLSSKMKVAGGDGWSSYYWSSSERSNLPTDRAWSADFGGGTVGTDFKYYRTYVRACLAF